MDWNLIRNNILIFVSTIFLGYILGLSVVKTIDNRLSDKVVTKISLLKNYCPAEEYHQKYLEKK